MRYIVHLLPEESRRRCLDDLRARLAEQIGPNKALDYPTTHVTLVYNIQDWKTDEKPIDEARLHQCLEAVRGAGSIRLWPRPPELYGGRHLLMRVEFSEELAALRASIFDAVRAVVADPGGRYAERAAKVKEQSLSHLTLAQDIDPDQARRAAAYLAVNGKWASLPLLTNQVALVARNVDGDEPYRISQRVTL